MRILYTDSDFGSSETMSARERVSLLELKLDAKVDIAFNVSELRRRAKTRRYDLIILDSLIRPSRLFELYRSLTKHAKEIVIVSDDYHLIDDAQTLGLNVVDKLNFERFVEEKVQKLKGERELN